MMNFLHVSFLWKKEVKSMMVLKPILDLAEDWVGYSDAVYVLYTYDDISVWQDRLRAVVAVEDCFLITEIIDIHRVGGWMPKAFWDLFNNTKARTIDQTLLPPPPKVF